MNFYEQLRKQLNFIVTSCKAYDAGRFEEATRIAVVARVLFHDTKSSHSLVSHHLQCGSIRMRSTTGYSLSGKDRHFLGFIGMAPSIGGFQPYLDNVARDEQIPLPDWWSTEPILELQSTHETITRRDVVLDAANKDGGAHVDPNTPARFSRLEIGLGIATEVVFKSGVHATVLLRNANLAILRQIGHEMLTSCELSSLAKEKT